MSPSDCVAIIPARMKSVRLPGKPLQDIGGKSLVQRVWERASKVPRFSRVIVASDDQQILAHAQEFGAEVALTSASHLTGSDRVAEVLQQICKTGAEPKCIANIQGDMPFINPELIENALQTFLQSDARFGIGTAASPFTSYEEFQNPSMVKVVCAEYGRALYFSRAPIPYWREPSEVVPSTAEPIGLKHMGLYLFRPQALRRLTELEPTLAERREKLEQLRAVVAGIEIFVHVAPLAQVHPSIEVDTPEDLERAREYAREMKL